MFVQSLSVMRWIIALALASTYYALGAYLRDKPLYYIQYYMPKSLNPWVETYNGPYIWFDDISGLTDEERRNAKNDAYYESLKAKMNE